MECRLQYDDRYTFSSPVVSAEPPGILTLCGGSDVIARGIGTTLVTLENGDVCRVCVTAAPLTVLLITGQSNGEGSTVSDLAVCALNRERSVVCELGQIYSTYAWSTVDHAPRVAGVDSPRPLSVDSAPEFVAETLTSSRSRGGAPLEYPLDSLAPGRSGKVGFDSALAWHWHRLTGDKVWVINAAAGGTSLSQWVPGGVRYENCAALMKQVDSTLTAELAAGHYELRRYVNFWLQGESNRHMEAEDYYASFAVFHEALTKDAALAGKTFDGLGIISVRTFTRTNDAQDIEDNGPRLAQKRAVADREGVFSNAFRACDVNDLWISDEGVANYWNLHYPEGTQPFPLRGRLYENPTAIADVHNGIHYFQPGYNEIGLRSAEAAVRWLNL